jgi:hypothetical protein
MSMFKKLAVSKTIRGLPPVKNVPTLFFSRSRALNLIIMGQEPTGKESVKKSAKGGEKRERICVFCRRTLEAQIQSRKLLDRASKLESRVRRLLYRV